MNAAIEHGAGVSENLPPVESAVHEPLPSERIFRLAEFTLLHCAAVVASECLAQHAAGRLQCRVAFKATDRRGGTVEIELDAGAHPCPSVNCDGHVWLTARGDVHLMPRRVVACWGQREHVWTRDDADLNEMLRTVFRESAHYADILSALTNNAAGRAEDEERRAEAKSRGIHA